MENRTDPPHGTSPGERALWTRAPLGGGTSLDLLTARFDRHRYAPHAHEEFTVGVCVGGTEIIDYRGGRLDIGPGSLVILAPGEPHTGRPGTGDGYAYRSMYPSPDLFADGACTPPHFPDAVLDDPRLAAALRAAHTGLSTAARAPGPPDRLAALTAESRLTGLFTALADRYGSARPALDPAAPVPGATTIALAVRDRLADDVLTPPTLAQLAAELGLSRYQLLRAFRTTMGMPPYAWLAQHRVSRARALLESGLRPAAVAGRVGFADQAHLTRWFRRVLGVTPAAYRSSVRAGERALGAGRA
ncbi:AraC family transcriptional regulator [Streptomyces alboflavus]|uniref:AraC family transcriptional regulator n=1 Tax=Streptomyces alboflavus TaxID=67267 RepID=UPI00068F8815|nr:AraC family transcriptional regulator [Streptomyces alboflavus]